MITQPQEFPEERRRDPKRRAEATVFDTLAECQRAGHVIYEWGAAGRPHRTDFALWLENTGRYAIEVKGGEYTLRPESDQWYLRTPDGDLQAKSSPLHQADDSAMDLRNEIHEQTGYKVFVIPVVVFPDMAPDPVIQKYAQRTNVQVIWGAEYLLTDLDAAARRVGIDHPPRASYIRNEVRAATVGGDCGAATRSGKTRNKADAMPPMEQLEVSGATINITIYNLEQFSPQHVEQVIVQQSPDPMPDCGF